MSADKEGGLLPNRASRRTRSETRISKEHAKRKAGSDSEPDGPPSPKRSNKSARVSRRSQSVSSGTCSKSRPARNPQNSGMGSAGNLTQVDKRKCSLTLTPGEAPVKKLKQEAGKTDRIKMAALWACYRTKTPARSPLLSAQNVEMRRSVDSASSSKYDITSGVEVEAAGSASSIASSKESHVDDSGKSLTHTNDLDVTLTQLSLEDNFSQALGLTKTVVEQRETSPPKTDKKKVWFKTPMVEFEGSQPR